IPGFALSALWSVTPKLDVSLWYKWLDAVRINSADVNITALYFAKSGLPNTTPCAMQMDPKCNITDAKGVGTVKLQLPMELKLGARFHYPREGATPPKWASRPGRRVRDPLSEDIFDIEFDFTWAQNSVIDNLVVRFPTMPAIPVKGTPGFLPANG